jgi:hypothetical protein
VPFRSQKRSLKSLKKKEEEAKQAIVRKNYPLMKMKLPKFQIMNKTRD